MVKLASRNVLARVAVEGVEKYRQSMASLSESNKSLWTSAGGLGDQIKGLSDKLGLKLPDGAQKALNSMNGLNAGTVAAMGGIAAAVGVAVKGWWFYAGHRQILHKRRSACKTPSPRPCGNRRYPGSCGRR